MGGVRPPLMRADDALVATADRRNMGAKRDDMMKTQQHNKCVCDVVCLYPDAREVSHGSSQDFVTLNDQNVTTVEKWFFNRQRWPRTLPSLASPW